MRIVLLIAIASVFFASCNNAGSGASFCDTTCTTDSFKFKGNDQLRQEVTLTTNGCKADTLSWTHIGKASIRKMPVIDLIDQPLRLNKAAVEGAILDTSMAWISFNDCITGRGYLLKIKLDQQGGVGVLSGALNRFDKKFSIDPDLRAYTDRGNIYVDNVKTGESAQMTFKEEYKDMKFDEIHKTLDSINVTKSRIYVKLLKNGSEVPLEKKITL
jgi:hypothetical protein